MRFIVTGGGTGGHIYPALAIAGGLRRRYPGSSVVYIGTARGLEADIVPKSGLEFHTVRAVGIKRSLSLHNLKVPWETLAGYREARRLLRDIAPRAVVGTGGYVCGPVVLAAARMKIPTLVHEQNALPGVTNRWLARVVDRVAVTFEDALRYFPRRADVRLTGLPVREEVISTERHQAREKFSLREGEQLLLSFGGSQGARSLNRAVAGAVGWAAEQKGLRWLHVTGRSQHGEFMDMLAAAGSRGGNLPGNFTAVPYLYDMPEALAAADLVICRAGAATIAELTVRGVPAVLVPFPYATGNHQEHNARALHSRGAAEMIRDAELSAGTLVEMVGGLLADPDRLREMAAASRRLGRPRALDDIIDCIAEII